MSEANHTSEPSSSRNGANTVASVCSAAMALHRTADAVLDAVDEIPAGDPRSEKADAIARPIYGELSNLMDEAATRRSESIEDMQAKASLAIMWCREGGESVDEQGINLLLSLARDAECWAAPHISN